MGLRVEPGHDWLHEEGTESPLIEHVGHHVGEGLGSHLPGLLELVHVHPELYLLFNCLNVSGQSRQANPEMGVHFKNLKQFNYH